MQNSEKINQQRIEAYQQIAQLEQKVRSLNVTVQNLLRGRESLEQENRELKVLRVNAEKELRIAIGELAKRRPDILSQEEWDAVLTIRGICAS